MTEDDFRYILVRLGYTADQPVALALYRVLVKGLPYGPSARAYSVPAHRVTAAVDKAREIEKHFTVTAAEAEGLSPNELLAYVREREAPPPVRQATVTADQLRAAGLTEEQIEGVLSAAQS